MLCFLFQEYWPGTTTASAAWASPKMARPWPQDPGIASWRSGTDDDVVSLATQCQIAIAHHHHLYCVTGTCPPPSNHLIATIIYTTLFSASPRLLGIFSTYTHSVLLSTIRIQRFSYSFWIMDLQTTGSRGETACFLRHSTGHVWHYCLNVYILFWLSY